LTALGRTSIPSLRRGLTLVEVMLVLALVVIMAAFTWPALERPMAGHSLRKAADVVRTEWVRTRVKAMSTGQTYLFRCAAGCGRYVIQCQAGSQPVADELLNRDLAGPPETPDALSSTAVDEGCLPEGITFFANDPQLDAAADSAAQLPVDSSLGGLVWSDPVLFYPDGTTSTARLQLKNEYDRAIELSLRGLTGTVTVGEVQSAGENPW
jgi:prepilin-type N-terminal cleavage/methylation domain-containing protein